MIVVSAPRCTLLRATEDLGLCKKYHNGDMVAFSYNDRDNFSDVGKNVGNRQGKSRGIVTVIAVTNTTRQVEIQLVV